MKKYDKVDVRDARDGDYIIASYDGHHVEGELYRDTFGYHFLLGDTLVIDSEGDPFPNWEILEIRRPKVKLPKKPSVIRATVLGGYPDERVGMILVGPDEDGFFREVDALNDGRDGGGWDVSLSDIEILFQFEEAA